MLLSFHVLEPDLHHPIRSHPISLCYEPARREPLHVNLKIEFFSARNRWSSMYEPIGKCRSAGRELKYQIYVLSAFNGCIKLLTLRYKLFSRSNSSHFEESPGARRIQENSGERHHPGA